MDPSAAPVLEGTGTSWSALRAELVDALCHDLRGRAFVLQGRAYLAAAGAGPKEGAGSGVEAIRREAEEVGELAELFAVVAGTGDREVARELGSPARVAVDLLQKLPRFENVTVGESGDPPIPAPGRGVSRALLLLASLAWREHDAHPEGPAAETRLTAATTDEGHRLEVRRDDGALPDRGEEEITACEGELRALVGAEAGRLRLRKGRAVFAWR